MTHYTSIVSTMIWSLAMLVACSTFPHELHAQTLGRLFTTTEQRTYIDNFKEKYNKGEKIEDVIFTPAEVQKDIVVAPKSVMYNGIVKRSDGSSTVWVNGKLNDSSTNKKNRSKNKLHHTITVDNSVIIKPAGSNTTIKLKPGQQWTPQTRQIIDPYQSSSVNERPSNTKPSTNFSPNDKP